MTVEEQMTREAVEALEKLQAELTELPPVDVLAIGEKVNEESPELVRLNREIRQLEIARDVLEGKCKVEERDGKIIATRKK